MACLGNIISRASICGRRWEGALLPGIRKWIPTSLQRSLQRPVSAVSGFARAKARRNLHRRLQTVLDTFSAAHVHTESQFVDLAHALRSLYSNAKAFADLINEHLDILRQALNESHITGNDGMAATSFRELQAGLDDTSRQLESLNRVSDELRRLRTQVTGIDRIGVFIRSSVFGFAVESARTADCQQTFGSFVDELRTLAAKIAGVADTIRTHVQETQNSQTRDLRQMSAGVTQLRDLGRQQETAARITAAETQALFDAIVTTLQQTGERTRNIAREADEAVYHLQFGDIVRQKSEHIIHALQEAIKLLEKPGANNSSGTQLVAIDQMLAIQAGQIELIREELTQAQLKLDKAFQSLAGETRELSESFAHWKAGSDQREATSDVLGPFRTSLCQLETLYDHGLGLQSNTRQTAGRAIESASQLAAHVTELRTINHEIHLQALNAIVKTAALGDQGVTLAVLSSHVDWLYQESNEHVSVMVSMLEAIREHAHSCASSETGQAAESTAWKTNLQSGLHQIETAFKKYRSLAEPAKGIVVQQQTILTGCSKQLEFLATFNATLADQLQELASLRQSLAPWLDKTNQVGTDPLHDLHHRYTMHSEREIHQRTRQNQASAVNVPATPPTADSNIDLFEPANPETPTQAPASTTDEQKAVTTKASASGNDAQLGDNVELF